MKASMIYLSPANEVAGYVVEYERQCAYSNRCEGPTPVSQ